MEGRTSGRPEVHYDPHRRVFAWRCHVETLSGACWWKCQGSGEVGSYAAAINAVYAHVNVEHRQEGQQK